MTNVLLFCILVGERMFYKYSCRSEPRWTFAQQSCLACEQKTCACFEHISSVTQCAMTRCRKKEGPFPYSTTLWRGLFSSTALARGVLLSSGTCLASSSCLHGSPVLSLLDCSFPGLLVGTLLARDHLRSHVNQKGVVAVDSPVTKHGDPAAMYDEHH